VGWLELVVVKAFWMSQTPLLLHQAPILLLGKLQVRQNGAEEMSVTALNLQLQGLLPPKEIPPQNHYQLPQTYLLLVMSNPNLFLHQKPHLG
jgi:hypothetical protein